MVVYSREEGKVDTLISREKAPHYAHKDMFEDDPGMSATGICPPYKLQNLLGNALTLLVTV